MKLKCIIIDDEPPAVDLLKSYALQTPFLELKGCFTSAPDALPVIEEEKINLIFLDINMPRINGLEFSKSLPGSLKIIFTTAYDQYALDGFKVNALDYLLKPISYADFLQASNRALEWFKRMEEEQQTSIFIKSGHRIEKIDFEDIVYIENQRDYVLFHLESTGDPIHSLISMQSLEKKLPEKLFMRVHRSFIVNKNKIKTIERNCIIFGKVYIPVSDSYKPTFLEFLNKYFF
jgi:Response regulator of the LytR/AlgR family